MAKSAERYSVADHFKGRPPALRALYKRIVAALRKFGPVREEPKKTSIHLAQTTAMAGVQVRKDSLILTVKSDCALTSPRLFKTEQASANRWHHEFKLTTIEQVDDELCGWLRRAYELGA